jgi:hypothetical protein
MADALLFGSSNLPPELDARVRGELQRDEQLLWVGQPLPARFARGGCLLALFGVPFTAFALIWIAATTFMAGSVSGFLSCFALFGLPFLIIGLGMLGSPFWLRQRAKRTCYALTGRRAIVWNAGWWGSVEIRSYEPGQLTRIRRVEYPDGCGDLVFEEIATVGADCDGDRTTTTRRYGFMAIQRVHEVEELLRKVLLSGGEKEKA